MNESDDGGGLLVMRVKEEREWDDSASAAAGDLCVNEDKWEFKAEPEQLQPQDIATRSPQVYKFKPIDVFHIWHKALRSSKNTDNSKQVVIEMHEYLGIEDYEKVNLIKLQRRIRILCRKFQLSWPKSRIKTSYVRKNREWLTTTEVVPINVDQAPSKRAVVVKNIITDTELSRSKVASLIMEAKLTKLQYMVIRHFVNSKLSFNLLPIYKSVME